MKIAIYLMASFSFTSFLWGCSQLAVAPVSIAPHSELVQGSQGEGQINLTALANKNSRALENYKDHEWKFNHIATDAPPERCIALSGGGIRSASYGIGVMKAINEIKSLDSVDLISSVSGGSWAVGWLYGYLKNHPDSSFDTALGDESLNKLIEKSHFIADNLPGLFIIILRQPYRVGRDNFFSSLEGKSLSPMEVMGEKGLGSQYAFMIANTFLEGNESIRMDDFPSLIEERRLPLFIINLSVYTGERSFSDQVQPRVANSIVEVTPLRVWGHGIGNLADQNEVIPQYSVASFFRYINGVDRRELGVLSDVMSVSGAAVDFYGKKEFKDEALEKLSFSLGRRFFVETRKLSKSYGEGFGGIQIYPKSGPLADAMYYGDLKKGASKVYDFAYLNDGGFAENLGAFSLIKRLCRNILIVDAEYDPNYQFGAYVKLKKAVKRELGADLTISALDSLLDWEKINQVTGEDYAHYCEEKGCRKTNLHFDSGHPVMEGSITGFPSPLVDEDPIETNADWMMNVNYVKLSIDWGTSDGTRPTILGEDFKNRYGETVGKFLAGVQVSSDCSTQNPEACQKPFPQLPTLKQSFKPNQMRAYIDLGYHTICTHLNDVKWQETGECRPN
jgi:hypothetical protein